MAGRRGGWWGLVVLVAAVGCVKDAPEPTIAPEPMVDRPTRRLDGGRAADAGPSDVGPPDQGARDAGPDVGWWREDAAAATPDAGCTEGARVERDCPEGGTQGRLCGPAGWAPWTPCEAACPEGEPRVVESQVDAGELVDLGGVVFRDFESRRWVRYAWVVVERPDGSTAGVVESYFDVGDPSGGGPPDDPSTPGALFVADVPGHYTFELHVDGGAGRCAAPLARVALTALAPPLSRLRVTLVWFTEGDRSPFDAEGVNLDLHLLHPFGTGWLQIPWDCHTQNPSPAWGPDGPAGDPWLVADVLAGPGPEEIVVDTPEETAPLGGGYCVGVHVFSRGGPDGELGVTLATVRVFDGNTTIVTVARELDTVDQFWDVGCIDVAPGAVEVNLHDRVLAPDRP
ncbi:MAG: hypothetical protein H6704_20480 [Myxococcales bacterium]|nr:hypothetical protein [Myxococcales bacterium]